MIRKLTAIGTMTAMLILASVSPAAATTITLMGDFGVQNVTGSAFVLNPGDSVVEPFSFSHASGTVAGEVHADNTAGVFNLTITNLIYEANSAGAAPNAHSIEIYVGQEYGSAANGPYNATHEFDATADLVANQHADVGLNTVHNFAAALPVINDATTGAGTALPMAAGPTAPQTINFTNSPSPYVLETWLTLGISGSFASPGVIELPASAHISTTYVPEPASAALLTAPFALLAVGRRRRRR